MATTIPTTNFTTGSTSDLQKSVNSLCQEARNLGAREGAQRLDLVYKHSNTLSLEQTYHWIDPVGFEREVEERVSQRVGFWHIIRNCSSVLPLILTWFALSTAAAAYQLDHNPKDVGKSFLQLWQEGFSSTTVNVLGIQTHVIPFSVAAIIDVFLLLSYLALIAWASYLDSRAYDKAVAFSKELQGVTKSIIAEVSSRKPVINNKADIDNVADAVQLVVDQAMRANKELIEAVLRKTKEENDLARAEFKTYINETKKLLSASQDQAKDYFQKIATASEQAINASNEQSKELYDKTISPMMTQFKQDIKTLHTELANYQARLNGLTNASQKLADVSDKFMANAQAYTTLGESIRDNIRELNSTQQGMLSQIASIGNDVKASATSMTTTANSMQQATKEVQQIATTLHTGVQNSIKTMNDKAEQTLSKMNTEVLNTSTKMSGQVQNIMQDMSTRTKKAMEDRLSEMERYADTLGESMKGVAENVDRTSSTLVPVGSSLRNVAITLDKAAIRLAKTGSDQRQPGKKGFLPWLLDKR